MDRISNEEVLDIIREMRILWKNLRKGWAQIRYSGFLGIF